MTEGNSPTVVRSKLGTKMHILTDKEGIPLSAVITSASTHDIKAVTKVIDNTIIKRITLSSHSKGRRRRRRKQYQHLSLDRAYNSKSVKHEIIRRGYVPHIYHIKEKEDSIKKCYAKSIIFKRKIKDGL